MAYILMCLIINVMFGGYIVVIKAKYINYTQLSLCPDFALIWKRVANGWKNLRVAYFQMTDLSNCLRNMPKR